MTVEMNTFTLESFWQSEAQDHIDTAVKSFETLYAPFANMLDLCAESIERGGKIMFFGNGGSAADAQHLATELAVRYVKSRRPIPALALTTDTSALTAIGNDYEFSYLFARQIEALGKAGDVAIGISTSGKSTNVLRALETAKSMDIRTIGFSGKGGGQMAEVCDVILTVPSDTTARIQEMHITLGQMLCGALEHKLGLI